MKYVIALDAGTTSVRAYAYDVESGKFVHGVGQEVGQSFPRPGWVEQDANEIYFKAVYAVNACLNAVGARSVAGIGITNQRETVVLWNGETGEPVGPAIVWQCRRTSEFCASLPAEMKRSVKQKTGLPVDAYFSASKIKWAIERFPSAKALLAAGKLRAGTVDSYLIYKLTEGRSFVTDVTNASRTMLFNIHTLDWDGELLDYFGVPRAVLPEVKRCTARMGEARIGGAVLPVAGVAGDQQAALFGQACYGQGDGKITYGTGLFMLFNTGNACVASGSGLLTTVGYALEKSIVYALEGSVFHAGSCIQWLRDDMGLLSSSEESERVAASVPDTGGVRFVPALTGLGAPFWDSEARGLLSGITRGTTRAHVVRAVLESIAYSARDLADCMARDSGIALHGINCDGGASANNFLMQFQADVLGVAINRPQERESTALGAAFLCALSLGLVDEEELAARRKSERIFLPSDRRAHFDALYREHQTAVRRAIMKI